MSICYILAGLGFGDEGKGSVTDYLARTTKAETVVRYNGGCQAAHRVELADGRSHVFSQFGSGTLAGLATHLSRFMMVEPRGMLYEADAIKKITGRDPFEQTTIENGCLITTPFHIAANRVREDSRSERHGSCGMGIGETVAYAIKYPTDALRIEDLNDSHRLEAKLVLMQSRLFDDVGGMSGIDKHRHMFTGDLRYYMADLDIFRKRAICVNEYWIDRILQHDTIFEGAQGVLLDESYGFHPHTTWSNCTFGNAWELIRKADFSGDMKRIGITRAYHTRHGEGPFPTFDATLPNLDAVNGNGGWQGNFRVGHLDRNLLRYGAGVLGGVDAVALTWMDKPATKICTEYAVGMMPQFLNHHLTDTLEMQAERAKWLACAVPHYIPCDAEDLMAEVTKACHAPIEIVSSGPTADDKASRCRP